MTLAKIFLVLSFLVFGLLGLNSIAEANHHRRPHVHRIATAGWGYYPVVRGLWFWNTPRYYGYNYYPFGFYYRTSFYQPSSTFGAISYSPETKRVGLSWSYQSQDQAMWAANNYCDEQDCEAIVWVRGGCAAIAVDEANEKVAFGYDRSRQDAEDRALQSCEAEEAMGCDIKGWVCTK